VQSLVAEADGAVSSLQKAILQNAPYIRATLKRPFFPDCPLTRPPQCTVLGSQTDVIAGCKVTVTVARAAPIFSKASVAAVDSALGSEASPERTALALAAMASSFLPALLPPSPLPVYTLTGGVRLSVQDGVHFFSSPEEAVASVTEEEAREGGLAEGWWRAAVATK